jgi:hypothetical protein
MKFHNSKLFKKMLRPSAHLQYLSCFPGLYKEVSSPILSDVKFNYLNSDLLMESVTETVFHTFYQVNPALSCLGQSCPVLSCLCPVLSCPLPSCLVLSCQMGSFTISILTCSWSQSQRQSSTLSTR